MAKTRIAAALLGGLLSAAYAGGAQADVVYTDFNSLNGQNNAVIDNFTVTSSAGGSFVQKTLNGSVGVGITGGSVPDEIDGTTAAGEYLRFVSNIGSRLLSSFAVSFLYATPAFGDSQNETASIIIDGIDYVLAVTSTTTASFSFAGATVTNVSDGSQSGGGEWRVTFGAPVSFTSLQFSPGPNGGTDAPLGDYAFNSFTTAAVPGPIVGAGLPGLVMALGGLVLLARRRRNHADVV